MHNRYILTVIVIALTGCATTGRAASRATNADIATTAAAIAMGGMEMNPMAVLLPLKQWAVDTADQQEWYDQCYAISSEGCVSSTFGWGNNACVIVAIGTGGFLGPGCIAVGFGTMAASQDYCHTSAESNCEHLPRMSEQQLAAWEAALSAATDPRLSHFVWRSD